MRQPPSPPHTRVRVAGTVVAAVTGVGLAAILPAPANAGLVPPAGVWPTNVQGARNPLTGTPFLYNGGYASATPSFHVWFSVRGRHRKIVNGAVGRRVVLHGRLRNLGVHHSIGHAIVTIAAQNVYSGAWYAGVNVATNRKGRFRVAVPVSTHTRLAAFYYPTVNSATPAFSRRVLIKAKSRVYIARPYRAKHRRFRFDGKVSGAAIPQGGLLVVLQVRNRRGNWISPRLGRTSPSGRFRMRYRFPGGGRFLVRVRAPAQPAWPLFGNTSANKRIHVRR